MKNKTKNKLYLLACAILGFFMYFVASALEATRFHFDLAQWDQIWIGLSAILSSFMWILALYYNEQIKKLFLSGLEEEQDFNKASHSLNKVSILSQIGLILAVSGAALTTVHRFDVLNLCLAILFLFLIFIWMITIKKYMAHIVCLYPEKNLDKEDFHFDAHWYQACDESEKMMIYKASYQSFKTTNKIYAFLLVVSIPLLKLNMIPSSVTILIAVIWMIQTGVYSYHIDRLEQGKKSTHKQK